MSWVANLFCFSCLPTWLCVWGKKGMAMARFKYVSKDIFMRYRAGMEGNSAELEKKNKKRDYINLLSWIMSEKLKRIRRSEVEHDKWMGRMDHWCESVKAFCSQAFNLRVWGPFQRKRRRLFPPIKQRWNNQRWVYCKKTVCHHTRVWVWVWEHRKHKLLLSSYSKKRQLNCLRNEY